jgi:hypothetical protein
MLRYSLQLQLLWLKAAILAPEVKPLSLNIDLPHDNYTYLVQQGIESCSLSHTTRSISDEANA